MKIAFFGSSLLSAYWNGAATYYRGLLRALHGRGHSITFYEPDAYDRQAHRDIDPPPWDEVVVYPNVEDAAAAAVEQAAGADLVVKASGVGVFDEFLEGAVLTLKSTRTLVVFWDVDAPATLERMQAHPDDLLAQRVPNFDAVFTYGGGAPVVEAYEAIGAVSCVPIYNALDPQTHYRVPAQARFSADLAFLGNRLPDREERTDEFFFKPAARHPDRRYLLGGNGWETKTMPANVHRLGHVRTVDHNALNSSATAVLNINRESMARFGFSPATRVFEAAGAAACVITDAWQGVEEFFAPGEEILVAQSGEAVSDWVARLSLAEARDIGRRAYARVRSEHTYEQRAALVEAALQSTPAL